MRTNIVDAVDGTPIWYSDSGGDGPAVVLLHGYTMTSVTNFERCYGPQPDGRLGPIERTSLSARLTERGARVLGVDARGHGRSGRSSDPGRYRGDAFTRDVAAVADAESLEAFDVVGYSMGSITAMRLLGLEPRLRGVCLCGTAPPGAWSDGTFITVADCFSNDTWNVHPELKVWRAQARLDADHDFESLGAAGIGIEIPTVEALSGATCPVLVLNAGSDDPDNAAATLASLIPGARSMVVGEADHVLACSDPAYQEAIIDFLAERW